MIGVYVAEDRTFLECYPRFTDHTKLGFKVKLPFHLGCRNSGEYGIAWGRGFSMWTMWGNSAYPRNPLIVLWSEFIVRQYKKIKSKPIWKKND